MLVAVILVTINVIYGAIFYSASVPSGTLLGFLFTLLVGAASFAALGLAITTIIPNADASPAIVNGVLYVGSGNRYYPDDQAGRVYAFSLGGR